MHSTDPYCQSVKELAGPLYEPMMRDQEAAFGQLLAANDKLRLAALLICENTWKCGPDPRLIHACYEIANSERDDSFRIAAIEVLARVINSSKSPDASRLLARIVSDNGSSSELQIRAYWGLRQIQFGLAEESNFLKSVFSNIQSMIRMAPARFDELSIKRAMMPPGCFPTGFWESVDEIDWRFVRSFL